MSDRPKTALEQFTELRDAIADLMLALLQPLIPLADWLTRQIEKHERAEQFIEQIGPITIFVFWLGMALYTIGMIGLWIAIEIGR